MANIFDLFRKIEAPSAAPITYVIAGLGNPGKEYAGTRHNVGFDMLDLLSAKLGVSIDRARFDALVGEATIAGVRVLLVKPQTYMNLSGKAVRAALAFYKIPPENLIVFCDDISFDVGCARIRRKGSHGGHNGLRNIIAERVLGLPGDIRVDKDVPFNKVPTKGR
jgi:PTH1 family peptidyl-tRNA hydrolase